MKRSIVFLRSARAEFDAAADWYEQRRAGLGAAFTASVERVLDRISKQPDSYARVYQGVHEAIVPRYPYCVYYQIDGQQIVVLAVFHTSRDPSIWQGRS